MAEEISAPLLALVKEQGLIDDLQFEEISGEFKRTPKRGAGKASLSGDPRQSWQAILEIGLSCYTLITAALMWQAGEVV